MGTDIWRLLLGNYQQIHFTNLGYVLISEEYNNHLYLKNKKQEN